MTTVLPAPHEREARLSPTSLRPPTAQTYFLEDQGVFFKSLMPEYYDTEYPSTLPSSTPSTIPSSPKFPSYTPTISSLSLNAAPEEEDEILLPSYDADGYSSVETAKVTSNGSVSPHSTSEKGTSRLNRIETDFTAAPRTAGDDSSIEEEPERHVDYLSHEWREEDIWASWRYVVSRRDRYSNAVRLENASWRTWAKSKYNLRTVSPETLNWLKDCDVTWLYGPLQTDSKQPPISNTSPPPSGVSSANSYLDRKSILKKKTASEAILQRSLSQHTLLKHAGAILQAQKAEHSRGRPNFDRSPSVSLDRRSDYSFGSATSTTSTSSGLISPSEKRHIHFNNEVVQCIAVEAKDGEDDDDDPSFFSLDQEDDDESDDGVVMMKQVSSKAPIRNRSTPRNSFSSESKTIAPLPSTTLKYRGDTPEPPWNHQHPRTSPATGGELTPSPSVETLRPPRPEANFLLDDEENDLDPDWPPNRAGYEFGRNRPWFVNPEDEDELESGRDLQFPRDEEGESSYTGLFGRVVDTVNTARDIAHVIWNVGWRR
ncbi:hypothetical protein VTN77DRAFT_5913 [Rasamsonia byssochlamydoides]|uniref:uncharacterized protein n=1 Tax=Rasamsonia byssochlamydoides TaxID=89139 RepID=UPI003742C07D